MRLTTLRLTRVNMSVGLQGDLLRATGQHLASQIRQSSCPTGHVRRRLTLGFGGIGAAWPPRTRTPGADRRLLRSTARSSVPRSPTRRWRPQRTGTDRQATPPSLDGAAGDAADESIEKE